jgi:hypothetical protein
MYKDSQQRVGALFFLIACAVTTFALAQIPAPAVNAGTPAAAPIADGLQIMELAEDPNKDPINGKRSHIGLNTKLWIVLSQAPPGDVAQYTLFLNDEEIKGLDAPVATTYRSQPALLFKLKRTPSNDAYWRELLARPAPAILASRCRSDAGRERTNLTAFWVCRITPNLNFRYSTDSSSL